VQSSDTTSTASFKSTQRQLTVMLVVICCAAVGLQLPYTVLYLLNMDKDSLWPDDRHTPTLRAAIYLAMKVADVFATASYALNFALYCVSGSAFRDGVRRICRRPLRQPQQRALTHDAGVADRSPYLSRSALGNSGQIRTHLAA